MIVTKNRPQVLRSDALHYLQQELETQYRQYRLGKISEQEYLVRIKPIDVAIGELEMATLQDAFVVE